MIRRATCRYCGDPFQLSRRSPPTRVYCAELCRDKARDERKYDRLKAARTARQVARSLASCDVSSEIVYYPNDDLPAAE